MMPYRDRSEKNREAKNLEFLVLRKKFEDTQKKRLKKERENSSKMERDNYNRFSNGRVTRERNDEEAGGKTLRRKKNAKRHQIIYLCSRFSGSKEKEKPLITRWILFNHDLQLNRKKLGSVGHTNKNIQPEK